MARVQWLKRAQRIFGLALVPKLHPQFLPVDVQYFHGEVTVLVLDDGAGALVTAIVQQKLLDYRCFA